MSPLRKAIALIAFVSIIILIVVFKWKPLSVPVNNDFPDIVQKLLGLALIALIIERALEVFMTTWRGGEADRIKEEVQLAREIHEKPKASASATKILVKAQTDLTAHSNQTRNRSFLLGSLIGITISLLGVRALEIVLNYQNLATSAPRQMNILVILDIVLTGLLLGGGADGIHKIVGTFTTYLDETSKKLKKGKP